MGESPRINDVNWIKDIPYQHISVSTFNLRKLCHRRQNPI